MTPSSRCKWPSSSVSSRSCFSPYRGHVTSACPQGVPDGPVRRLVLALLEAGSSRGAAFPSSHVAVATTQFVMVVRYQPRLSFFVFAISLGLAAGAVYGGFHYAVDALAGVAVGDAGCAASGSAAPSPGTVGPGLYFASGRCLASVGG